MQIKRRQFLSAGCFQCAGIWLNRPSDSFKFNFSPDDISDLIDGVHIFEVKKAKYFSQLPNQRIRCEICPKKCEVDHLERGFCGTRENRKGKYYVLTYSNPCAIHIDPIEKKPFSHFLPKSDALSISTAGCNMMCKFCQNWQISQFRPEQTDNVHLPPEKIIALARDRNVPIIAYTYAEPIVFYEYMYKCSELAQKNNIKNVMISAGYINDEPLRELVKVLDAVKVDLKAFSQSYYQDICSSELEPVLKCLEILHEEKIWYEIVYLVVPTLNDDLKEIQKMSKWIRNNLSENAPIHFSRFHPTYMMKNLQSTPVSTLENIRKTALDVGLNHVYIGNVVGHEGEHTYCPSCNKIIIRRVGYHILENHIKNGSCGFCSRKIAGVWN